MHTMPYRYAYRVCARGTARHGTAWHGTAWQVQLLLQEGVENIDNSELAYLRCFERFDSE
jgi:hypothetical protein